VSVILRLNPPKKSPYFIDQKDKFIEYRPISSKKTGGSVEKKKISHFSTISLHRNQKQNRIQ